AERERFDQLHGDVQGSHRRQGGDFGRDRVDQPGSELAEQLHARNGDDHAVGQRPPRRRDPARDACAMARAESWRQEWAVRIEGSDRYLGSMTGARRLIAGAAAFVSVAIAAYLALDWADYGADSTCGNLIRYKG